MIVEYFDENKIHLYRSEYNSLLGTNYTEILLNNKENFYIAKYDNIEYKWIEGGTNQQVKDYFTPIYMKRLQDKVLYLRHRSREITIDKDGDEDYLGLQKELYEIKYLVAIGEIINPYVETLIHEEAIKFFTSMGWVIDEQTTNNFKQIIIYMYNAGEEYYHMLLMMIEVCRTSIQTLIEYEEWDKVRQAFIYADSLTNVSEAQTVMSQILSL